MPVIGIRELARQVSRLVGDVETTREPAVITRHGRPVAILLPVDAAGLEDFVLAKAPEFAAGMKAADADLAAGRTRPLSEVLAELDQEDERAAQPPRAAAAHR